MNNKPFKERTQRRTEAVAFAPHSRDLRRTSDEGRNVKLAENVEATSCSKNTAVANTGDSSDDSTLLS